MAQEDNRRLVTYNPNGNCKCYEVLKPNPEEDNKGWQTCGKRYTLKGIRSLMQEDSRHHFIIDGSCLEGQI